MSSLSDNTQEVLKEIFDLYKNANDGKFCRDQVANAVRAAGLVPTNEDVSRVLGIADDQNSNPISVTFEELCSIYEQLAQNCAGSYEELVECLKVFDKDSKGKISAVELKQLLTALGEKLPSEMVDELLNELQDNNADVDIFDLCSEEDRRRARRTGHEWELVIPVSSLEAVRSSSLNTARRIWNHLPEDIAAIPDPTRFKNAVKSSTIYEDLALKGVARRAELMI